jgi:hypothetical protein
VANASAFADVQPGSGKLPALVYGTAPKSVRNGTPLAVVVNGKVGAVVRASAADEAGRRFGALITDESLFREGANEVAILRLE